MSGSYGHVSGLSLIKCAVHVSTSSLEIRWRFVCYVFAQEPTIDRRVLRFLDGSREGIYKGDVRQSVAER